MDSRLDAIETLLRSLDAPCYPAARRRRTLIDRSHHVLIRWSFAALIAIAALAASEVRAQTLTPFRYEAQAQLHCPGDAVVWLDFRKRRYYARGQRLYGRGLDGSFVCLQEARSGQYRRSLLGR